MRAVCRALVRRQPTVTPVYLTSTCTTVTASSRVHPASTPRTRTPRTRAAGRVPSPVRRVTPACGAHLVFGHRCCTVGSVLSVAMSRAIWRPTAASVTMTVVRFSSQLYLFIYFITFPASRRPREMCCGHARLCVCLSVCVCLSAVSCPHYCTDPDVTWGSGRGCPLVVYIGRSCNRCTGCLAMATLWKCVAVIRQAHRTPHACRTRTLRMPAMTPLAGDKMDTPAACAVPFCPYCGVL